MVHALIADSRKYNPDNGKRLDEPYLQLFTRGEWMLFEKQHENLGIVIEEVLHNPFK